MPLISETVLVNYLEQKLQELQNYDETMGTSSSTFYPPYVECYLKDGTRINLTIEIVYP